VEPSDAPFRRTERAGATIAVVRIAEIAPPWFTVPPTGYGGIELVVSLLTEELVDNGHDVTLFAAAGSTTKATLVTPLDAPDPALLGNVWFDVCHALSAYLDARDSFDVIHDHSGIVGPALGALLIGHPPVVHTLHGPWTEPARRYYSLLQDKVSLVAISEAQRGDFPELCYAATVHNGIDLESYPYLEDKDEYLVYIGRATPDKGPLQAIEIAREARIPLKMLVKRNEPFELAYWDEAVAPKLHDEVEVFERVSHDVKAKLLAHARAMVFPIQWPEPFGLVMIEAMACGTPVVACPRGAATEIVSEGETGFLRSSLDELVEAVHRAGECSSAACRQRVAREFSTGAMVAGYERVFEQVAG
jgi:glycosyltransferase involved in cell wall biosynthesis